jgi:NADH-quinone oxidoreductase subunit A
MPDLLGYLLLFTGVGAAFIFVNLMVGKFIRPATMNAEKATIYECGEPTIGSAWVQFDLRFYVVALLFVIFDVEMAFFFPWAVVFGKANELADPNLPAERRTELIQQLPTFGGTPSADRTLGEMLGGVHPPASEMTRRASIPAAARLAWVAFFDILFFFGVLLVGFAYLWKRGDLDWVRSTAAQKAMERSGMRLERRAREELVMLNKD